MIRYIKGRKYTHGVDSVIIENSTGIGFEAKVPLGSPLLALEDGEEAKVFTSMIVREDDISLYGFSDKESIDLFEILITVNGIGAKAALAIMGTLSPRELYLAVASNDAKTLSKAPGVGKKTAERIILELKDKVGSLVTSEDEPEIMVSYTSSDERSEAIKALESLGYTKIEAANAIEKVKDDSLSCEQYIIQALKNI